VRRKKKFAYLEFNPGSASRKIINWRIRSWISFITKQGITITTSGINSRDSISRKDNYLQVFDDEETITSTLDKETRSMLTMKIMLRVTKIEAISIKRRK